MAALGLVAAAVAVLLHPDGASFGYGKGAGAYLFHAGVFAVLLAGADTLLVRLVPDASPDRRALVAGALALPALGAVATGLIWYDLVLTPPPNYGADPTLAGFVRDRFGFALAFAPLAAGHAVGLWWGRPADERWRPTPGVAPLTALVALMGSYAASLGSGTHPGFAFLFYLLLGVAGVVAAVPLALLGRAANRGVGTAG
jgi:hypothetical protein